MRRVERPPLGSLKQVPSSSGFVHFEVSRVSIPAFSLENICFDLAGVETLGLSIFELPVRQGMIQIGLVHLLSGEDEIS